MATKKTDKSSSKAKTATKSKTRAPAKAKVEKAAPKAKGATVSTAGRHPRARVTGKHGSKEALAKALAPLIARGDEDTDQIATRLQKASNSQLLRLQRATDTLREKYGDRGRLIAAIGTAKNKGKDKDFLAKLETYSLPQLLDLAKSSERRARS